MKSYIVPFVLCIALAWAVQSWIIAAVPRIIFALAEPLSHEPLNTLINAPRTDAKLRRVVLPNPDFIYSAVFYDVSKGDLLFSGKFPDSSQYACLAFYNNNLQPYYVVNNQKGITGAYQFRLTASDKKDNSPFTIHAQTKQGSILMRLLVTDTIETNTALAIQKGLSFEQIH